MLTNEYILTLLSLKGCGPIKVLKIALQAAKAQISNTTELALFLCHCGQNRLVPALKTYLDSEIIEAHDKALDILEEAERNNVQVISFQDEAYPQALLKTIDENERQCPPIILYCQGSLKTFKLPGIAIIGTREPTPEGVMAGEYYGKLFAERGYNIVSGLALGCDTAGHKGALATPNGKTTAFVAQGLDSVYPPQSEKLAREIVDRGGLLVSEYPIGVQLSRYNLVARDRLQAALAQATIVIQTGAKGGTHHAANMTLAAKKPLFCVHYESDAVNEHESVIGNTILVQKGGKFLKSKTAAAQLEESLRQEITKHAKQPSLI